MPRVRTDPVRGRIYWRSRHGRRVAYADFRDFADVGGKLEALIVPGERQATSDESTAVQLSLLTTTIPCSPVRIARPFDGAARTQSSSPNYVLLRPSLTRFNGSAMAH